MRRISEYLLILYALTGTISITVSQALMALGALVGVADRGRRITWRRTGLEAPVAAWVGATVLASLFAATPVDSFEKMRKVVLFAMLWWPLAAVTRPWSVGRLYMGLLFSAGVTSMYGVLVFFFQGGPGLAERIEGFHGFYLTNSGLLLLCTFPAVLFATCRSLGTSYRWGAGIAAVSILAAQFLGQLPGAWLGTAAGTLFLAFRRRKLWLAALVPAAAAAFSLIPGPFQESAADMLRPGSHGNVERARAWMNGLELFAEDPLTGWGLQDLRDEYARVKAPGDPDEGHMVSVPAQIAASMGIPGLAAFGWLVVLLFRRLNAARNRVAHDDFLRASVESTEAGLVGFLFAGLVEWNFGDSEILALLFFLVGTALAAGRVGAGAAEPS